MIRTRAGRWRSDPARKEPAVMKDKRQPVARAAAVAAALSLIVEAWVPILAAPQATPTAKPPPQAGEGASKPAASPPATATPAKPAAAAAATTPPVIDGGWPRHYGLPGGGHILLFQPQNPTRGKKH